MDVITFECVTVKRKPGEKFTRCIKDASRERCIREVKGGS